MLHTLPALSLATLEDHMVTIKGGEYENEKGEQVSVRTFQLCRFPVNQLLWQEVMEKVSDRFKFHGLHRPIERVSWHDCQQFIRTLNQQTRSTYRLPWRAEWEYAANEGIYQRGFEYAGSDYLNEVGWHRENSYLETIPSGYQRPNAFGLYDLSGNVWEWAKDSEFVQPVGEISLLLGGSATSKTDRIRFPSTDLFPPDFRAIVTSFRLARSI